MPLRLCNWPERSANRLNKKERRHMNKSESKYFNTALRMNEALITLLEKKDLEYITVKEICQTAGVNRSTFYLHYESVSDLVNETVETINARFLSYVLSGITNMFIVRRFATRAACRRMCAMEI